MNLKQDPLLLISGIQMDPGWLTFDDGVLSRKEIEELEAKIDKLLIKFPIADLDDFKGSGTFGTKVRPQDFRTGNRRAH